MSHRIRQETLAEMIEALEAGARLDSDVQREALGSAVCPCCGSDKRFGHLLCPRCFSVETPTGLVPFKYSGMLFSRWLEVSREEQAQRGLHVVEDES